MNAWTGTILRVNLTNGTIKKEPLDVKAARAFIGARGLAAKMLFDEVDPNIDALSPENKLFFAAGPLTGTFAPNVGRYDVVCKSPLTGAIAASNSGGSFGPELKYAGYDMIIFEGKAPAPVYLWIHNDQVELRDASALWGKEVPETTDLLRAETDEDAKVACIGPAGEKLSFIASVMNEMGRAAGRSGVGAVMGSKNLKAIAVVGTGGVSVADKDAFAAAAKDAAAKIKAHPVGGTGLKAYGTDVLVNILNSVGSLPTRNFQDGYFPTADKTGGEALAANNLLRPRGCHSCIIECGRATKVTNPKFAGEGEGPEYESAWGFGADCGIDNLDAIIKANFLCNDLGLDTISTATTIACAMDLYEAGIITLKDTGGIPLNFGNAEVMVELVKMMGNREGFGDKMADGSWRLADAYGHPEYSMSCKKQEMPAYDPRGVQGIGLHYATSNRGGCHVRGYTIAVEVLGNPVKMDQHTTEGKPDLVITFQNLTAALDSTGACLFATFGIGGDELAALLSGATGIPYSTADFMKAGERIWNLERMWNLAAGLSSNDDVLPERLLHEPIKTGPSKGEVSHLNEMLPVYYDLRGWDANGVPSAERLETLGLA
ncbi:aldehyde ferredoxin oxidoreductase family protein [Levilinea saccharolytica]|uniref:Aldehyde:ferredoxin oxidoreductase n=1 Tax=Levilinea saccharolytica TaxID=229921 RepID=A0A0P6Y3T0_9CHLR|nr:aldehyde ferredoxin oxidoreductase family protein [Levilinea saccharolytica]KPL79627.1 aldehyde:ferredoxin oxidoreductase [Levilinea saccharolytica]GAP17340.1 aldehyde:ferredoxin oxidoreductase [Levilinea saccharolytica]